MPISPGSTRAYLTWGANRFAVVDLAQIARTRTVRVGASPVDLAVDRLRNLVYVTNRAGKSVSVVNPVSVRVARTFRVRRPVGGMGGKWVVEPVSESSCRVRLLHDFFAASDDPADLDWISQAVDRNSTSELHAL